MHLWEVANPFHKWVLGAPTVLQRDFGLEAAMAVTESLGVQQVVLVQSGDNIGDTFYLQSIADTWPAVLGVVGWLPLRRHRELTNLLTDPHQSRYLCGARMAGWTNKGDSWLLGEDLGAGFALLSKNNLALDVYPSDLPYVEALAAREPELRIVLDHLGGLPSAIPEQALWAQRMERLGRFSNVYAKLSSLGVADDADRAWARWGIEHALQVFGSSRLMFGSNWPVVTALEGEHAHLSFLQSLLPPSDLADVAALTSRRVYTRSNRPPSGIG